MPLRRFFTWLKHPLFQFVPENTDKALENINTNPTACYICVYERTIVTAEMSREMYHGRLLGVPNSVALNR